MSATGLIASPEPDLAPAELVARARRLVPYLRDKGSEIEAARQIPFEVDHRLREDGFYRMLQPRRYGGYESDLDSFTDAMLEIFRGDGATGWVTVFVAAHILWICALEERAQREILGHDGDVRTVVTAGPTGKATPRDGGYVISGRWDWCSGFSACNWFIAVAIVQRDPMPQEPETIIFTVPCDSMRVEDNWHVLGLQGTGSVAAHAPDIFVPLRYTAPFPALMFEFAAPGYGVLENPFYRAPLVPILWLEAAIAMVGMLRGLIDLFVRDVAAKPGHFPPFAPLREDKKVQGALGRAVADHDVAKAALRQLVVNQNSRIERTARGERLRWADVQVDHVMVCRISRLCVEAADTLFHIAGSSLPIRSDSAFGRFYRDIKAASAHRALGFERAAENSGMAEFGLAPATRM
jgi:3-hydroxy-9,10-secoandrosta-1,3,5(10)-triene-9,17-dione monooxygenase